MSVKVMAWVWGHSRSKANARLVLLAIADCASDDGANAYPSMAELVRKTGLSERTVQAMLGELTGLSELVVDRNSGPRGCNRYRVRMPPAESAPPQDSHPAESAPPQISRQTPAESAPGTVLEPSKKPPTEVSSSSEIIRADVEQVCRYLADRIAANGSQRPTITKTWRTAARLLIDKDGRTVDQVIRAIDWCQNDDFWRANILSMPKLRTKYDQLRLAANRQARASPDRPSTTDARMAQGIAAGHRVQAMLDGQTKEITSGRQ